MRIMDWSSDVCSSDLSRLLKNNMMRTSNKLFGLVILLVLTLPLLVVVFLLKSVREESFTIRDPSGQKISRGMYTQGYKTLKIVAPAHDHRRCHFFPADRSEERRVGKGGVSKVKCRC